jgi:hypothetical protein
MSFGAVEYSLFSSSFSSSNHRFFLIGTGISATDLLLITKSDVFVVRGAVKLTRGCWCNFDEDAAVGNNSSGRVGTAKNNDAFDPNF